MNKAMKKILSSKKARKATILVATAAIMTPWLS